MVDDRPGQQADAANAERDLAAAAIARAITGGANGAQFVTSVVAAAAHALGGPEALVGERDSREAVLVDLLAGGPHLPWEALTVRVCPSKDLVHMGVDALYDDAASFIWETICAERGLEAQSSEADTAFDEVTAQLDRLRNREYAAYAEALKAKILETARHSAPAYAVAVEIVSDFAGPTNPTAPRVGEQQDGLARVLWAIARRRTPLPGTELKPSREASPGRALRDAGVWPHLRIAELAAYGRPPHVDADSDT